MFGRRTETAAGPAQPSSAQPASAQPVPAGTPVGKGRPTPKRRDAVRDRRGRAQAPQDRKAAAKLMRQREREERLRRRDGLMRGEDRYLPARDRGPVKALVRDRVDSRRSAAELFLPGALVVFALGLVPTPLTRAVSYIVWLVLIVAIAVDSFVLMRGVRGALKEQLPAESSRGITAYALLRSMQVRRLRMPKPRVKPGRSR